MKILDCNMRFFVYIIQSEVNGSYYVGCTANLQNRFERHNSGRSKSTKRHIPWKLVYMEKLPDKSMVMKRERQIKAWKSRKEIE